MTYLCSIFLTVPYLNIEAGNRRLNIGGWYVFARRKGLKIYFFLHEFLKLCQICSHYLMTWSDSTATSVFENCPVMHSVYRFVMVVRKNVLEYIITLVVVKICFRSKKGVKNLFFSPRIP
jgi:hypothetical protein